MPSASWPRGTCVLGNCIEFQIAVLTHCTGKKSGTQWRAAEVASLAAQGDQLIRRQYDDTELSAGSGSVVIGGLTWNYATGLTDPAGLTLSGSIYTLVLDDAAGTGLTAIPEPGSLALLALGGLFIGVRRRSR